MSYLQRQMNFLKFDKRLLEINFKKGNITEEEYQQHLVNLPDDEANSMTIDLGGESEAPAATNNTVADSPLEPAQPMPTNNDPFGSGF